MCESILTNSPTYFPGLDLHDSKLLETFNLYFRDGAPAGWAAWLEKNLAHHDPVSRGWRLRDGTLSSSRSPRSFKCSDDKCIHFVYGFLNQHDRDQHTEEHLAPVKRDSGLSVGGTPPLGFPEQASSRSHSLDFAKHTSPVYLPRPTTANHHLAPLNTAIAPPQRDHRDSLRSYSFVSEYAGGPRGSVDSEVDPLLPPLKRSRVGQSRLESIEELKLRRDIGPCLRCKILNRAVSQRLYFPTIRQLLHVFVANSSGIDWPAVRLERPVLSVSGSGRLSRPRLLEGPRLPPWPTRYFRRDHAPR